MDRLVDDDAIAGEIHASTVARRSTWGPRVLAVTAIGVRAGALPSLLVFAIYFTANRDADLPWVRIATLLAGYGPAVGILLAGCVALLVAVTDRIAKRERGLVVVANPIVAGGAGGMLAGIAPGAIGVPLFGAYHGPFVGTGLIAAGLITGAMMVAVPLAVRARRARGVADDRRAIAAATLAASLILCAVAAVVAPVIVGSAFEQARGGLDEYGAVVGAVAGAIGGGVVGVFIGITIALGRSLGATAAGARTATSGASPRRR